MSMIITTIRQYHYNLAHNLSIISHTVTLSALCSYKVSNRYSYKLEDWLVIYINDYLRIYSIIIA